MCQISCQPTSSSKVFVFQFLKEKHIDQQTKHIEQQNNEKTNKASLEILL